MFLRKTLCLVLIVLVCMGPTAAWADSLPRINSAAGILMDVNTGEVLFAKDVERRLPIASLTKVMTALLAVESDRLSEVVVVPAQATLVEPSNIWLVEGERILLQDLVYGLMLRSGNDAALAIALYLHGSVEAFSTAMNSRARELGATSTNFVNPHGLPHPDHYSTAYDFALITRAALRHPVLKQIVGTERHSTAASEDRTQRTWHNKNRLLQLLPGADGVKTGWTRAAGHCLASSVTWVGWTLLTIVLDSPDHYGESRALLEWGLRNYMPVPLIVPGLFQGSVAVNRGNPASIGMVTTEYLTGITPRGQDYPVSIRVEAPLIVEPPVNRGDQVGTLIIEARDFFVTSPLVADRDAVERSWLKRLLRLARDYVDFVFTPLVKLV